MKKVLIIIFGLFAIVSCGKKDVKFEAFSPEAFAYDLGDSWEVNSQVMVKGFLQFEKDGIYTASIKYSVDLIKPNGEKVQSIFADEKQETKDEAIMDVSLEAQFELDSSYQEGSYKIIYKILDLNSENQTNIEVQLELIK
ncbi:MAG: hypothetical protein ROY99_03965 [Ignavibacterium sp.]|jgi:hypothetical protein|nr:hypothetical protein [Ignavibacterium sp.]